MTASATDEIRKAIARRSTVARRSASVNGAVVAGVLFTVVGLVVTYFTWGSWWLVFGIVLLGKGPDHPRQGHQGHLERARLTG